MVSAGRRPRAAQIAWIVTAAASLLAGLTLFATGITPWAAPLAVLLCLTLAVGQRTSWPFAVAASIIIEMALIALVVRFTPETGLGLVSGAAVVLGVVGTAALVAFARVREPRVMGARALRVGLPVLVLPLLVVLFIAVRSVLTGEVEWAMRNDAVWNLVTTRLIVADGGLSAVSHPNSSPLTPALLAVAIAVGREAVSPDDLLRHDVGAVAVFWLLASLGAGLLAGLIGARSVHGGTRTARIIGGALADLVPFSWFTFGFAAEFGFYNATVTLVLLFATWLAWLETRVAPIVGAAVLSLATVALLATWAPLAVIPFGLAAMAIVARLSSLERTRSSVRPFLLLTLAMIPVPLYVFFVTLPDLARDGGALAVDGAIMALEPAHVLVIAAVTIGFAVVDAVQRHRWHQFVGVLVVIAGGAVAVVYLIAQRLAAGSSAWGYYPAKFSWLLVSLLLVIIVASIAGEMAGLRGRRLAAAGIAATAVAVPGALMLLVPPTVDRLASLFTPFAIATNTGVNHPPSFAQELFDLAVPGQRTMVVNYLGDGDVFLNSWLLQLESTSAQEPIRVYSYILDPQNTDQACEAVRAWDAPVRVVTSDEETAARMRGSCGDAALSVEVRSR